MIALTEEETKAVGGLLKLACELLDLVEAPPFMPPGSLPTNESRRVLVERAVAALGYLRTVEDIKATTRPIIDRRDVRQRWVGQWALAAFGVEAARSIPQRALRLLEEALETYQAVGAPAQLAHRLIDFIFARPLGSLEAELGGVAVTLLAVAEAANVSVDDVEAREIERIKSKPVDYFRGRNLAKNLAGFEIK